MSGSHRFIKISMCLCLFVGTVVFSGCDKIPTWGDITGDEKKEDAPKPKPQAAPKKQDVVVKPKAKPKPKPVKVKVDPEQAIAMFKEGRSRDITDLSITKLIDDMGDKIDLVDALDLRGSKITLASVRKLGKFTGLRDLDVTQTRLDEEAIELIGKMTELEHLSLNNIGNLSSDMLKFLENLVNLKTLRLNNTNITDAGFESFMPLENLEKLEFSGTGITGKGFAVCRKKKKLKALKYINANNTSFGLYGFVGIQGLKDLEVLLVRKATITDPSLGGLKGCKNLLTLDLAYNNLSDKGVYEVAKVKSLEELNLQNALHVTDQGLKLMTKLRNLKELTVVGTKCTPRGVAAFKKKLKDVKVNADK